MNELQENQKQDKFFFKELSNNGELWLIIERFAYATMTHQEIESLMSQLNNWSIVDKLSLTYANKNIKIYNTSLVNVYSLIISTKNLHDININELINNRFPHGELKLFGT